MPTRNPRVLSRAAGARLWLAFVSVFVTLPGLRGAAYVWDPANTSNGATIDAGSGTWDIVAGNTVWNNAGTNVIWAQTNITTALHSAQFGGADAPAGSSYNVTLGTSVAVAPSNNGLWFANSGYNLTAATTTRTITSQVVTISPDKTATLSGTITLSTPVGNSTLNIGGLGTLTLKDGARIAPSNNISNINHGTKVVVETGGTLTGTQVVVGAGSANATLSQLTVSGGTVTIGSTGNTTSTASNLVIANVNSGTATATVRIASGTVQNLGTGRASNGESGLRFGATASGGTISGSVDLDGGNLVVARVYENAASSMNSTFNFNGGVLKVQTGAGNAANFLTGLDNVFVKEGGAIIDTNGVATTIAQPLLHGGVASTDGGLVKQGNGTLTLTGANTYTGATNVNAGTLAINAPYSGIPTSITVNSGGRLQIVTGATASTLPGLTLNSGGSVELGLGVYDPARLAGVGFSTLNAAVDYPIHLSGTNIPVGDYTVFTYSGKTGAGVPLIGVMPPGVTATVQDTGSAVVLSVLTPQLFNYVWSAGTGAWDTSSTNWNGLAYVEGSVATFPDIAGNQTVTLSAPRSPFSVSIQNILPNTYTLTGAALGGSATVAKSGTGAATFAVANTYTGATTVSEGALVLAADGALGSASGSTTVSANSSIAISGGTNYATPEKIIGSGLGTTVANVGPLVAVQRGFVQSIGANATFAGPIELSSGGVSRLGVQDGAQLTLSGPITRASGVTGAQILFRAGTNNGDFITLTNPANNWDGGTVIYSSAPAGSLAGLRLGANNVLPITGNVTAANSSLPGTTLDLNGFSQTINGLTNAGGTSSTLVIQNLAASTVSTLTLNPSADITNNAGGTATLVADGLGKVALTKAGLFKQTLGVSLTYTGPTTISAGTLAFNAAGSLGNSTVSLASGSTLDVAGVTASTFALGAGLSGSGTLTATGKTVTVSTSFTPGALAVTGNLGLASGTATNLAVGSTPAATSAVTVSGALVLNGTLVVTKADGFDFAAGQTFVFATAAGGITPGLTGVTVNGQALVETSPDVWTANIGGLDYSFTESTATLTVSNVVLASPLQAWRNTYFPGEGNNGTGIGANDADPDGDGISNLLEYATGTIPTSANPTTVTIGAADGRLALSFPRINDPALIYTVQGRNDLVDGAWVSVAAANNPSTGGATPVTVQDEVAISAQPRRFLRLEVKLAP